MKFYTYQRPVFGGLQSFESSDTSSSKIAFWQAPEQKGEQKQNRTMRNEGSGSASSSAAAIMPPASSASSFPGRGDGGGDGRPPHPHIIPSDDNNEHQSADLAAAEAATSSRRVQIVDELPPLSSIEQKISGVSSTSSSLSDGIDGTNTAQDGGGGGTPNNNTISVGGGDLSTALESDPATKAADKKAAEARARTAQQKQKKVSLKSIMKKRPASPSGDDSRESLAMSSSSSALSSSRAGNSSQSRTSIGWGWFEHNSSNALTDTKAQEGDRPKSGKSSKKKKKKGGMLQGFQSAILGEQIEIPISQNGKCSSSSSSSVFFRIVSYRVYRSSPSCLTLFVH